VRPLLLPLLLAAPALAQQPPRWQVFLLVGQSNMEGKGRVEHLEALCGEEPGTFEHLRDGDGWAVRDDVFIDYLDRRGPLTVGYGTNESLIGPELQIGNVLGDAHEEPVLLIKLAWGGKSLVSDFRPPGAGGEVGPYYEEVLARTAAVLGSLEERFPDVDARGHDLRGLVWFQGWNDRVNQAANDAYEENLVHLLGDLRAALGAPDLPTVVGESGQGGPTEMHPRARSLMERQRAACARPEVGERVRFVPTRHIWHDVPRFEGAYHWHGNARNFYELGDAMGRALLAELREEDPPPTPSVVLVMTDDQGWGDVGYHGHPHLRTPHLDALAAEGVALERFYAAAPVCSPTRASALTGRHPARMGIDGANDGHLPADELHLGRLLRARGYRTGFFGKWHLGTLTTEVTDSNRGGREQHTPHYAPPWDRDFEVVFATEAKVPTYDPMLAPGTGEPYGTAFWTGPGARVPDEALHGDDSTLVMDQALAFVEARAAAQERFLAVVWLHAPHKPVVAGEEHLARYADVEGRELREYLACLSAIDDEVGRLRARLRELGIAEDTLLLYCSDNGPENRAVPGSAGPLRGRKRDLLEGGVRVPAMLEWPAAVAGGRAFHGPAGTVDILPTVLDAVGASPYPTRVDGMSLLPRLAGTGAAPRYGFTSRSKRAWHDGRWKLHSRDAGGTWALYDLEADPGEASDLAGEQPERVEAMARAFAAWEADVSKDRKDAPEASR